MIGRAIVEYVFALGMLYLFARMGRQGARSEQETGGEEVDRLEQILREETEEMYFETKNLNSTYLTQSVAQSTSKADVWDPHQSGAKRSLFECRVLQDFVENLVLE
jgi:hypothetical protein